MEIKDFQTKAYADAGLRETTIKGSKYTIKLMSGYVAFSVGMRLVKAFLPALGAFFDSEKRSEFILPEEDSLFTEIAIHVTNGMDKIQIVELIQAMFAHMQVNGVEEDPDQHFRGKLSDLVKVIEFALKENFSDFFTDYLKEKGFGTLSLGSVTNRLGLEQTSGQSETV